MKVLLKNFIKILIFINIIPNSLTQTCNLRYNNPGWLQDWHLLLVKDQSNQYQLLRSHTVPKDSQILLLCNEQRPPVTAKCLSNQRFDINLPLNGNCLEKDAIQSVRIIQNANYCDYTLYKFGYKIKMGGKETFLEAYQVCFDRKYMRTIFTINKAYPVGGGRPDFQFSPDDIFKGNYFYAFTRENTFKRFQLLLGRNQPYMQRYNPDHIIDRGHLTPSADFALTNLKHATFQMINVMPQFKTIDNGNWRFIEQWARDRSRTPSNICNGVLGLDLDKDYNLDYVLKLKHSETGKWIPIFLADNRKIPIPLWIYKIVKYQGNGIVFLTMNNIYHQGVVQLPQNVCKIQKCPLNLSATVKQGYTFCCEYHDFINRNVPKLRNVC